MLARTSYGVYFLFGGCTFLTAVVCWLFMPETRGKSLDEIEQAFYHGGQTMERPKKFIESLRKILGRKPLAVDG